MNDQTTSSAAAAASPASDTITLTAREQQFCIYILQCLKHDPIDIDFDKFMEKTGLATVSSARSRWAELKRKLFGNAKVVPASAEKPKATPSKAKKSAEPKTPKTPKTSPKSAMKQTYKEDADIGNDSGDGDALLAAALAKDSKPKSEEPADTVADDDATMEEVVPSIEGKDGNLVSPSGEMSPPATPAATPVDESAGKPKATTNSAAKQTPKQSSATIAPKTAPKSSASTTGDLLNTPNSTTTGTPTSTTPKKRGRPSKADKAAASVANGEAGTSDAEDSKPAKKARKTKAQKEAEAAGTTDSPKTVKKPRKTKAQKDAEALAAAAAGEALDTATTQATKAPAKTGRKPDAKKVEAPKEEEEEETHEEAIDVAAAAVQAAEMRKVAADAAEANEVLAGKKKVTVEVKNTDETPDSTVSEHRGFTPINSEDKMVVDTEEATETPIVAAETAAPA